MWYKHTPFVSVLDVLIVHTGGIQLVLKSTPLSFEIDTSHVIPRFGMVVFVYYGLAGRSSKCMRVWSDGFHSIFST